MAMGALKFMGLAVCAVMLGALSASFAFGRLGPDHLKLTGYTANDRLTVERSTWLGLNAGGKLTNDEILRRMRHIMRRD